VITFAFYIPSHDMIMSVLMEIRFDKSGSVRTRSFEVLPTQIYVAGESKDENVIARAKLVLAFSVMRIICSTYTLLLICLKISYRSVIGVRAVVVSVLNDVFQISLAVVPVIMSYQLQDRMNLANLSDSKADWH